MGMDVRGCAFHVSVCACKCNGYSFLCMCMRVCACVKGRSVAEDDAADVRGFSLLPGPNEEKK